MWRTLPLLLARCATAQAQPRPTSDAPSPLSGRTLGNGETLLAGAVGWPGVWAAALFSPSSQLDIGVQIEVDYGSPFLGVSTGVGGALSVPLRLLVYGKDDIDMAIAARVFGLVGEGALIGQRGVFADELGWGIGSELGLRVGFHVSEDVTLGAGASGLFAYTVSKEADSNDVVGGAAAVLLVEVLLSGSSLLFAEVWTGYGFAPSDLYGSNLLLRLSLGVAFRP